MRNVLQSPGWFRVLALVVVALLASPARAANYLDDTTPDLARIVPPPPANDSAQTRRELDELLQLQHDRTPKDVEYARANIPIGLQQFAAVLGHEAEMTKSMPASVKSLFEAVRKDESALLSAAKKHFDRPRPIALDSRIEPVLEPIVNSAYPSGHATWVFMTAVLLADLVPERRAEIWARAEDFARQRVVGGVHYSSDIDAGRIAGAVVAAYLLESPRYRADAATAGADLRSLLKLPALGKAPAKAASASQLLRPAQASAGQVSSALEAAATGTLAVPFAR